MTADEHLLNFWRAYLVRAIRDLDEWLYARGAEEYIRDGSDRVLGFRWVCSVLGYNADVLRDRALDPALRRRIFHGNRITKRAA